ncbi:hypothetical protein PR048_015862 [Dryococelus australis]|uniref:Uncharacterized protein n=1 Tax=Dryococelus australis TaxID=614101 RepID=A0ABQ9HIF9_9NEOP|nr:hypothetical protein PR048_015862 [Dryococelus australis]
MLYPEDRARAFIEGAESLHEGGERALARLPCSRTNSLSVVSARAADSSSSPRLRAGHLHTRSSVQVLSSTLKGNLHPAHGGTLVILLASNLANRVRLPAKSLPDFRMWESCRMMPLVGDFLGDLLFVLPFNSGTAPYSPQSPSSALNTSLLRAVKISSLIRRGIPAEFLRPVLVLDKRRIALAKGNWNTPRKSNCRRQLHPHLERTKVLTRVHRSGSGRRASEWDVATFTAGIRDKGVETCKPLAALVPLVHYVKGLLLSKVLTLSRKAFSGRLPHRSWLCAGLQCEGLWVRLSSKHARISDRLVDDVTGNELAVDAEVVSRGRAGRDAHPSRAGIV